MKIRQMGTKFFHADGLAGGRTEGRTDRQMWRKLIVAFRYFASALKNEFLVRRHKPFGDPDKIRFRGKGKENMIVCLVLCLSACPSFRLWLLAYFYWPHEIIYKQPGILYIDISCFFPLFHRAFRFTKFYLYQRMHLFLSYTKVT